MEFASLVSSPLSVAVLMRLELKVVGLAPFSNYKLRHCHNASVLANQIEKRSIEKFSLHLRLCSALLYGYLCFFAASVGTPM